MAWDSAGVKSPSEQQAAGTDECLRKQLSYFHANVLSDNGEMKSNIQYIGGASRTVSKQTVFQSFPLGARSLNTLCAQSSCPPEEEA